MAKKKKASLRGAIIYARVTPANKKWLEKTAAKLGLTMSDYINTTLSVRRENKIEEPDDSVGIFADFR
jgi:hypothetical protein